jgi:hypothetical protein
MMNNPWKIVALLAAAVAIVVGFIVLSNFEQTYVPSPSGSAPHGHDYRVTIVEANCTEGRRKVYTCSCGESYEKILEEPLGHKFDQWVSAREPSADAEGVRQRTCKVCGTVEEENYTVWMLTYEEYLALTPAQQQAYYETFEDYEAYFAWLNQAKEDYENSKDQIEIDGSGSLDLGDIIGGKK